ncbi:MAG: hypothetical protein H0U15_08655, partial [Geodermatophilaceae bacterium]|nr:hypothetical protein [Geodermatophilaceae bacterium]
ASAVVTWSGLLGLLALLLLGISRLRGDGRQPATDLPDELDLSDGSAPLAPESQRSGTIE